MEITVYSVPHCGSCKILKQKLNNKGILFSEIEDIDKIVELSQTTNILRAPIVRIDTGFFTDVQTIEKLGL